MDCPNGHGPMLPGRKRWVCEDCKFRADRTEAPPAAVGLTGALLMPLFPAPMAFAWRDFSVEVNPVLRLYRLCDAVEITIRFLTITALGEVRRAVGSLPDGLLRRLQPNVERPTLGRWWAMLQALATWLPPQKDLVFPELPPIIGGTLSALLDGPDALHSLIVLRNDIHHGGAMKHATARNFVDAWAPRALSALDALGFLADAQLQFSRDGDGLPLTGPGPFPAVDGGEHRVALHRGGLDLDLWPLCDYGPALADPFLIRSGPPPAGHRVFLRAERDRLLFTTLGIEPWQGESRNALAEFRALFQLDRSEPEAVAEAADFEREIRLDAGALIGRARDVKDAKEAIKDVQDGVLWIGGPGGIGKTYLMAKLAYDFGSDPQKVCRLAWRFRAGDGARCSRQAFLRYAVRRLSLWGPLGADVPPDATDPPTLRGQLVGLLERAATLGASGSQARPPRVLFFLDGLDEVERLDPGFARLPFELVRENIVWVCAGRAEGTLPKIFAATHCRHVFAGSLPPMRGDDVRAMLMEETGPFKYALLAQDEAQPEEGDRLVTNAAVEAVMDRAQGLPLYVRHVIADVVSGHFRFDELARRLPPSLAAYYNDLLDRLGIGDLPALLTPLLSTIVSARGALDEDTLTLLLTRRKVLPARPDAVATVRRGLAALQSMIRPALTSDGHLGYEPYYLTFREHVRESPALAGTNAATDAEFCDLARDWSLLPYDDPARHYALYFGPGHLYDAARWSDLFGLVRGGAFLRAQADALVENPASPLNTLGNALKAAADMNDAPAAAEFTLASARWFMALQRRTPLDALRAGHLRRAVDLTGLADPESGPLWKLLLVWELQDTGQSLAAETLVHSLLQGRLPALAGSDFSRQVRRFLKGEPGLHLPVFRGLLRNVGYAGFCRRLLTQIDQIAVVPEGAYALGQDTARERMEAALEAAQNGRLGQAQSIASGIERWEYAALCHARIAAMRSLHAPPSEVRGHVESAIGALRGIQDWEAKNSALRLLPDAAGPSDPSEIRLLTVSSVIETARKVMEGFERVDRIGLAAEAEAGKGDAAAARTLLAEALRQNATGEDWSSKVLALTLIAGAQAAAGQFSPARHSLREAESALMKIRDERETSRLLTAVAVAHAKTGDFEKAERSLRRIGSERGRAAALSGSALAAARSGAQEMADALFARAIETAQAIDADEEAGVTVGATSHRGIVLRSIASDQIAARHYSAALVTCCKFGGGPDWMRAEIAREEASEGKSADAAESSPTGEDAAVGKLLGQRVSSLCAAYKVCADLAVAFPEQATAIAEKVLDQGWDGLMPETVVTEQDENLWTG